jgi:hypothetical protein
MLILKITFKNKKNIILIYFIIKKHFKKQLTLYSKHSPKPNINVKPPANT